MIQRHEAIYEELGWNVETGSLYRLLGDDSVSEEEMVRPRRFELLTYSFGGCRSIQLSYGRMP
jgi:hypothetical protein